VKGGAVKNRSNGVNYVIEQDGIQGPY